MTQQKNAPGYRIVPSCRCCYLDSLRVVLEANGTPRIEWRRGEHVVHDLRTCLRCAAPLRVEVEKEAAEREG